MTMKRFKFLAATLAVCMTAASFVACNNNPQEEPTKNDETEVAETENETSSTEAEEETPTESDENSDVEESVETEAEVDLTLYKEGSFYDFQNDEAAAQWYNLSRDLATQIHEENPDVVMYYGVQAFEHPDFDFNRLYFSTFGWGWVYEDASPYDFYEWNSASGEVEYFEGNEDDFWGPNNSYTYEDFMRLPMIISDRRIGGDLGPMELEDSTPDGYYNCCIRAISLDGTKALAVIQEPVYITAEEYANIKPGDHLTILDDDPRFGFKLDVRDEFSFDNPSAMFKYNCLFFQECEDGNYLLVAPNGDEVTYWGDIAATKTRIVFLDIAPDCEIIDDFREDCEDYSPYGFVDAPNTFTRTYRFYYKMQQSTIVYNDWIRFNSTNTKITVQDNAIVSMNFVD